MLTKKAETSELDAYLQNNRLMKIIKLDSNNDGWILGKVSLYDYITSLSVEKFNYAIQRGVVSNPYLDTILDAVVKNNPLPPISLTAEIEGETITEYNILDGLQRTCRLWIYFELSKIALENKSKDYKAATNHLKKYCDFYLKAVSPRQVRNLFDDKSPINVWNLQNKYRQYELYLYIWTNLTKEEEVKNMLILNAGQKRMSLSHQYELIYLRLFEGLDNIIDNGIKLIRAKDEQKHKPRKIGEYNISTVIISIQSLLTGKPMRLTQEMLYNENVNEELEDISVQSAGYFLTQEFIKQFLSVLYTLDDRLSVNEESCAWFGKDTTLSGLMAAIGSLNNVRTQENINPDLLLKHLQEVANKLQNINVFKLKEYNTAYDNLASAKINIGMIVRKAITSYTFHLLSDKPITWLTAFNEAAKIEKI